MMRAATLTALSAGDRHRLRPPAPVPPSTVAKDTRLVEAVEGRATRPRRCRCFRSRSTPTRAEADGTTPLHWAVRNNDIALMDRLIRAGAKAAGATATA